MMKANSSGHQVTVLLAGMKHCGKSTHGRALARHWNCDYYDTDDLIVEDWYALSGRRATIRELFTEVGEEGFRKAEARVFAQLCTALLGEPTRSVVSLGGRLAANPLCAELLPRFGLFVFIRMDLDVLFKRVMRRGRPPFLSEATPREDFGRLYAEREPHYLRHADLIIDLDDVPVKVGRHQVIASVETCLDARK